MSCTIVHLIKSATRSHASTIRLAIATLVLKKTKEKGSVSIKKTKPTSYTVLGAFKMLDPHEVMEVLLKAHHDIF